MNFPLPGTVYTLVLTMRPLGLAVVIRALLTKLAVGSLCKVTWYCNISVVTVILDCNWAIVFAGNDWMAELIGANTVTSGAAASVVLRPVL